MGNILIALKQRREVIVNFSPTRALLVWLVTLDLGVMNKQYM